MKRFLVLLGCGCVLVGFSIVTRMWVYDLTQSGPDHGLWNISLPGLDIGVDTFPATATRAGYLDVWCYPHDADDFIKLFQIPGAAPQQELQRSTPKHFFIPQRVDA